MFDIGFAELLIIGVVALLVIGPERLPEAVRTASAWINRLRRSFNEIKQEVQQELHNDEVLRELRESGESLRRETNSLRQTTDSLRRELSTPLSGADAAATADSAAAAGSATAGDTDGNGDSEGNAAADPEPGDARKTGD